MNLTIQDMIYFMAGACLCCHAVTFFLFYYLFVRLKEIEDHVV